jgi:hypothetical protein
MGILDDIDPDLPALVDSLSASQLRALAIAACRFALERTGLDNEVVAEGLRALEAREFSNEELRRRLEGLVGNLDEKAWSLMGLIDEGRATEQEYAAAFAPARAANALSAAFDLDARAAAVNTLYEAYTAIGAREDAESPIDDPRSLSANEATALRLPVQAALMAVVRKAVESHD